MDTEPRGAATPNSNLRFGVLLIAVGLVAAADAFWGLRLLLLWPLLVTALGAGFVGIFLKRGRRETPYLAFGVYLISFSVLALYCNLTSWAHLAKLWPLFIAFMGLALLLGYRASSARSRGLLFLALAMLSVAAGFYLMGTAGTTYWWITLVLLGASLLVAEKSHGR